VKPDESRTVYEGRVVGITIERWGSVEREVIDHPGAVAILAVDGDDCISLVRQLRMPARRYLLELPAGTREAGEEPLTTATRELREECGLTGGSWRELAAFWTMPGFCREYMHLYLAEGVMQGEPEPMDDENIEVVRWPVGEIEARLGEIEDAKTLVGLLLFLRTGRSALA
jgi:ADP-ribose pyrophosphatase